MADSITIEVTVAAPRTNVWKYFTLPEHMMKWNHASDDWHSPSAENDLRVGGTFRARMEAKDGSEGFDFGGTYTEVAPEEKIAYAMDDGREVTVLFEDLETGTRVVETFDPETENSLEMQRGGWQSILDNFKHYAESL